MTNLVVLKGSLGGDPEFHDSENGQNYVVMSLAVTNRILNQENKQWQDGEVNWFRCASWKSWVILDAKNLHKGSLIRVEGKLKQSEFKDKQGNMRTSIDIIINSMEEIVRRSKKLAS